MYNTKQGVETKELTSISELHVKDYVKYTQDLKNIATDNNNDTRLDLFIAH